MNLNFSFLETSNVANNSSKMPGFEEKNMVQMRPNAEVKFNIIILTNREPDVRFNNDEALMSRMRMIPFDSKFID